MQLAAKTEKVSGGICRTGEAKNQHASLGMVDFFVPDSFQNPGKSHPAFETRRSVVDRTAETPLTETSASQWHAAL